MLTTQTDIEGKIPSDKLLQLCDDTDEATIWTPECLTVLQGLLQLGDNFVYSYIAGRYPTPVDPALYPALKDAAAIAVVWFAVSRRGYDEDSADKLFKDEFNRIEKWLTKVGEGRLKLTSDTPKSSPVKVAIRKPVFDLGKY